MCLYMIYSIFFVGICSCSNGNTYNLQHVQLFGPIPVVVADPGADGGLGSSVLFSSSLFGDDMGCKQVFS